MKIHIFNPENDMALADGSPGYTPPANIRAYRKANWQLPRQWAEPEDIVWDGETEFRNFGISENQEFEICPWGWSPAIVHQLETAGFPREKMPSQEYLDKLRTLSSRASTVAIQKELGVEANVCRSLEDVQQILFTNGRAVLKSPWSSSGKGLMMLDNPNWQGWVKRIIRQQGAVIVERKLDRLQDFAMEFWMYDEATESMDGKGKIEYCGLSVFKTDEHGHYLENIQGSEEKKLDFLVSMCSESLRNPFGIPSERILDIKDWYLERLPEIAPWYRGPVGVDMLITCDGQICPCIEINWRMTMGMVALLKK